MTVPGIDHIDISPEVEDHRNVLLMTEGGGILFLWQGGGIYEAHVHFFHPYRGANAITAMRLAMRWMFTRTDCMTLWARVPETEKNVEIFIERIGAIREFFRPGVWPTSSGNVGMSFWSLDYEGWIRKTPSLANSGFDFLSILGTTSGEECVNRRIGAMIETLRGGEPEKAVILYSKWARLAKLPGMELIARNPLVVRFETAVLHLVPDGEIKVIK